MVRANSLFAWVGVACHPALGQSLKSNAAGQCEDECHELMDVPLCYDLCKRCPDTTSGACHPALMHSLNPLMQSLKSNAGGRCKDECHELMDVPLCYDLCKRCPDGITGGCCDPAVIGSCPGSHLQADEKSAGVPSWPHTGATKELPQAILAFYAAVQTNSNDMVLLALDFIDDDAYWAHTGEITAVGKDDIEDLFKKGSVLSAIDKSTTVQYVATEGDASSGAASYVISRAGEEAKDHKRDAFVVIEGKIKMVWTTNGNAKDPTMDDGTPWYDANQILVARGDADDNAIKAVQTAIDVYFKSFQGHDAQGMRSVYHETNPLFMPDFDPERKAPYPCGSSSDCGTIPYWNNYDEYLGNFEVFVEQPSLITLNQRWTPAGVYGDFAFVSSVSNGCEGNYVTPDGYPPAPNRELFIATKNAEGQWKIRFYSFNIDPKSPIPSPVDICQRKLNAADVIV